MPSVPCAGTHGQTLRPSEHVEGRDLSPPQQSRGDSIGIVNPLPLVNRGEHLGRTVIGFAQEGGWGSALERALVIASKDARLGCFFGKAGYTCNGYPIFREEDRVPILFSPDDNKLGPPSICKSLQLASFILAADLVSCSAPHRPRYFQGPINQLAQPRYDCQGPPAQVSHCTAVAAMRVLNTARVGCFDSLRVVAAERGGSRLSQSSWFRAGATGDNPECLWSDLPCTNWSIRSYQ